MTAGPPEGEFIAVAAGPLIDDAGDAEPVDRDETVDIGVVAEQRLDATQVAKPFLAGPCRRT